MFHKLNVKFVIDAVMFLCMAALAGIGFLMKYVLLSGKEAQVKYGTKVELSVLGLDRHEWGTVHLIIAFVLVGLLILHIVLNWKQIVSMFQRLISSSQISRKIITAVFTIVCVLLIIFPFIMNPEVQEIEGGGRGEGEHGGLGETAETIQVLNSPYEIDSHAGSLFVVNDIS